MVLGLLEGERWWGGRVSDGLRMPYGTTDFSVDLAADLNGNQACPLLISTRGRFAWSENPFAFTFHSGRLEITGQSEIEIGDGFGDLRSVYRHVSTTYFPTNGQYPDELLFCAPQYNLWIELLYEPTQVKVLEYARNVLKNGLPPGVIMIDDNWHEPYGTWRFHSGRFPNPKQMVDELHAMGFKVMLWICPFVSPDSLTFRQLERKGYLLKQASGHPIIRQWWNGYSAILDCTNDQAVAWLHAELGQLQTQYGIDGFKFDAGDPAFYASSDGSAVPASPTEHCEAWGRVGLRYRLNEYRACWKLAGQPLAQRLKDKDHAWGEQGLASLIPHAIAQGLMGYSFTCPDMIGGGEYVNFTANADNLDAELFVRYAQCSALFPMMQFSAAPWRVLDAEHSGYCVEAAQLHARLGSEIVELTRLAAETGEPILQALAYAYPNQGYEDIQDQFLLGDNILVAPVLAKGARSRTVQIPPGCWHGDDGSVVVGPCHITVDAPLSRLPWYRRQRS